MSPVSRGRKRKQNKKSSRRPAPPDVLGAPDECDCPSCSGMDFDPRDLIDDLLADVAYLVELEDPLDAEVVGAAFVSIGAQADEPFEEDLVGGFIPEFEARASAEALALLLAIGSVTQGRIRKAASVASDRLVDSGVLRPGWAAELGEPLTLAECWRLSDSLGIRSVLACSFHRSGRSHALMISVDHLDCGAASDIRLFDVDQLLEVLKILQASGRDRGLKITKETLDAAEFRRHAEKALDARAVHDSFLPDEEMTDVQDDDGLGYPTLAVLVRARMNNLPEPSKPAAPHGDGEERRPTVAQLLAQLAGNAGGPFTTRGAIALRG